MPDKNFYERVYALVKKIPPGKVTTYGRVAAILHAPQAARAVGYALRALRGSRLAEIPWQRVINAQGKISLRLMQGPERVQKSLLEAEGVVFDDHEAVDLKTALWEGSDPR